MILCCGEALIDMIPADMPGGQVGFVPHPGGAVFNTAIALGRLGAPAGLLTGLSTDLFGRQLADALDASHVDPRHAIRSDRPTTLAFVQLVDGQASYLFYDENSAGRMITASDLPPVGADVEAMFFGGISLASQPCADAYAALLAREGAGRVVMIDPNIRPQFIEDETAYRPFLDEMIAQADIVKVSDDDLDWIIPGDATFDVKAGMLLSRGPSLVVVTRGAQGATGFLVDGRQVSIAAEPVKVADTVGAGDTFNAGLLAHLSKNGLLNDDGLKALSSADLEAALTFAAKVAAVTVSRPGADPPWAAELFAVE